LKILYLKQKIVSLKDKYTVSDEHQENQYFIEGSFAKIPKRFTITDKNQNEVAEITRNVFTLLPKFTVDIAGQYPITIKKHFSLFNSKFTINSDEIEVRGQWWDFNFEVYKNGQLIGKVSPKILTWADTYELLIYEAEYEKIIVSLTVAIDCAQKESGIISDGVLFID
jgi:uncharacterized protein YxjI